MQVECGRCRLLGPFYKQPVMARLSISMRLALKDEWHKLRWTFPIWERIRRRLPLSVAAYGSAAGNDGDYPSSNEGDRSPNHFHHESVLW